jgi:hypothetical protein
MITATKSKTQQKYCTTNAILGYKTITYVFGDDKDIFQFYVIKGMQ